MKEAASAPTYIIAAIVLFVLMAVHLLGIYPLASDKFAVFLVSLFIAVMLLPLLKHLKFFDIVELRRGYKALQRQKK